MSSEELQSPTEGVQVTGGHDKRVYIPAPPGAGAAAILMFFHIALTGYLGYASFYLIRNWEIRILLERSMSWEFFLPAGFAIFSCFPTDPLTRVCALVARVAGFLSLVLSTVMVFYVAVNGTGLEAFGGDAPFSAAVFLAWAGIVPGSLLPVIAAYYIPAYRKHSGLATVFLSLMAVAMVLLCFGMIIVAALVFWAGMIFYLMESRSLPTPAKP